MVGMKERDALLLSIREEFSTLIFAGQKTVELRRVRPDVQAGDQLLVYVPEPVGALVGSLTVARVMAASPSQLWSSIGSGCGLSRARFQAYFQDLKVGFAICVHKAFRWEQPISRRAIQTAYPRFRPPQGYIYLRAKRDSNHPLREFLSAA
jgi:predicted transcriptional regulator